METRSNQVLVGSIVLGLIAALVVFAIWLTSIGEGGQKTYDVFFQQSVEGLAKGSGVTFRGVPVGQIESINLEPNSPQFIRVRISVSDDTPILQGTTATIRGVGFTGVSQIQLDPPEQQPDGRQTARQEIRCPEQNPQSECPYGYPVIPTRAGGIAALLNSAPELLERVSRLTERLTALLTDRNQESIAGILDNLEEVSRNLAERSPEIAATLAEARTAIRQAGHGGGPDRPARRNATSADARPRRPAAGRGSAHHPALGRPLDAGIAGRDQRRAAGPARLLEPDPARSRPAHPRPARDLRIAARDHRSAEPAGRRRRDRRPAPAQLPARETRTMMRIRLLVPAAALLALAGCFGGGAPSQLLTLTPSQVRPAASPQSAGQGAAITIVDPTVPQALRTTRIPVYVSDTTHPISGGRRLGRKSRRALRPAARRDDRGAHRPGRARLPPIFAGSRAPGSPAQLHRFGLDPARMEAVVVYDATMPRGGGIVTNRFEARVPVAEATPAAVAPALNQAANQAPSRSPPGWAAPRLRPGSSTPARTRPC